MLSAVGVSACSFNSPEASCFRPRARGRPVTLAEDALFAESLLVVPPQAARIDGQRIDGREMVVRSERFTLWRVDDRCVLRRESTGERIALLGADCRALQR